MRWKCLDGRNGLTDQFGLLSVWIETVSRSAPMLTASAIWIAEAVSIGADLDTVSVQTLASPS